MLLFAAALTGCEDPPSFPCLDCGPPWWGETPQNDTPENLLRRFEATYEYQVLDQFELLLTRDFRFRFSKETDPTSFAAWPTGWTKLDEVVAASHLFDGFTNGKGEFVAGASDIRLEFGARSFVDDPAHPDSTSFYRLAVVTDVNLVLEIPGRDTATVRGPHFFHLVRGDIAVLDSTQRADSTRWYVRRWDDQSPAVAAGATTWGAVKAIYRR